MPWALLGRREDSGEWVDVQTGFADREAADEARKIIKAASGRFDKMRVEFRP